MWQGVSALLTHIAVGIAESFCYECPKPAEFGSAGPNWSNVGWKIDVRFTPVPSPVRPADHMHVLAPLLTERYAPLRPNGHGLQSIYLTALEPAFAGALLTLLGAEVRALAAGANVRDRPFDPSRAPGQGQTEWEEHLIGAIRAQPIEETEDVGAHPRAPRPGLVQAARAHRSGLDKPGWSTPTNGWGPLGKARSPARG